jgi:hypothetical protein
MPNAALIQRRFDLEVRARKTEGGDATRSFDVIASTADEDCYDEIVLQNWDLGRFLKNPVCLYDHNSNGGFLGMTRPEDSLPIGFCSDTRVEGGKLIATLNIVDEKANPLAERVYQGLLQKSLRAVSVGFMPGKARMVPRSELGLDTWHDEDGNEAEILTLDENELYEISVTSIPANAACVTQNAARVRSLKSTVKSALAVSSRASSIVERGELLALLADEHGSYAGSDLVSLAAAKLGMPEDVVRKMAEQVLGSTETKAAPKREPQPVVPAPAVAPAPMEKLMELELLAKSLGCEPTVESVTKALEARSAERVSLLGKAAVLTVVLTSLSLEESTTEGQAAKAINDLTSKASRVDALAEENGKLAGEVQKHLDWLIERDVAWIVQCGERGLYEIGKGQNQKALLAYRKSDPKGFETDFAVALEGLKAFDRIADFTTLTTEGGALSTDVGHSAPHTADGDNFDQRVKAYRDAVEKKTGKRPTEVEAIWAVGKGLDPAA